jgi:hypothetical protein
MTTMAVTNLSANNPESANDQNTSTVPWQQPDPERLARQFSRLGWIGFWI